MPSILHLVSATLSPMNMWTVCHPYISLYARILNWPSPEMTMSRTSHPPKNGRVLKLPLFDSPKFLTLPFFLEWQVLDLVISGRGHIWQQNVSIVALLPNICCKHFFSHCFFWFHDSYVIKVKGILLSAYLTLTDLTGQNTGFLS